MDHSCAAPCQGHTPDQISNMPHQHAFILVGKDTLFGVHMTQYHHEEHKYQLVMKLQLTADQKAEFDKERAQYPDDTFVLSNAPDKQNLFMIPELAAQRRTCFLGNIFQGLPAFSHEEAEQPHFFPWDLARTRPRVSNVAVKVTRIVTFRPFAHHLKQPDFATYLLWGEGEEAHMTNLQTARLASGPFEVPAFGPDYDHVLSLQQAPTWLHPALLEAGVVVSVPAIRLRDATTGAATTPTGVPIAEGTKISVLYRGLGTPRSVLAGHSPLAGTAVCNSPGLVACAPEDALVMSPTPRSLMVAPQ